MKTGGSDDKTFVTSINKQNIPKYLVYKVTTSYEEYHIFPSQALLIHAVFSNSPNKCPNTKQSNCSTPETCDVNYYALE
jgi:hypothetical protein